MEGWDRSVPLLAVAGVGQRNWGRCALDSGLPGETGAAPGDAKRLLACQWAGSGPAAATKPACRWMRGSVPHHAEPGWFRLGDAVPSGAVEAVPSGAAGLAGAALDGRSKVKAGFGWLEATGGGSGPSRGGDLETAVGFGRRRATGGSAGGTWVWESRVEGCRTCAMWLATECGGGGQPTGPEQQACLRRGSGTPDAKHPFGGAERREAPPFGGAPSDWHTSPEHEIGRASCRERV